MTGPHPLSAILLDAANARFPPADGAVEFVGSPPGRSDAVVAFTAHHVVAADVDPDSARAVLPAHDLGAPMSARFLVWLGEQIRATPGMLDLVLAALPCDGDGPVELPGASDHSRAARADRYREDVRVYGDAHHRGIAVLGRGLAGRLELAIEVAPEHRGRGLGRALAFSARSLVTNHEPLFAQVSPGNTASIRAFLAAGFQPIGAEVLFLRDDKGRSRGPRK